MDKGLIRDEIPADAGAIRQIHLEAFGGDIEAGIVDLLLRARQVDHFIGDMSQRRGRWTRGLFACYCGRSAFRVSCSRAGAGWRPAQIASERAWVGADSRRLATLSG